LIFLFLIFFLIKIKGSLSTKYKSSISITKTQHYDEKRFYRKNRCASYLTLLGLGMIPEANSQPLDLQRGKADKKLLS
jgi:hypothetical protein